jgi:hypothetical protein
VEGLERAFAAVEAERMDARTGTALATIAAAIVRAVTASEQEERLRALEQQTHVTYKFERPQCRGETANSDGDGSRAESIALSARRYYYQK